MRLYVTPKHKLSPEQLDHLNARIAHPAHANDRGALKGWEPRLPSNTLYAIVLIETQLPIGTLYAAGDDLRSIDASWWMDLNYRGRGLGSEAIDQFAAMLLKAGVTGVGRITIDTYAGEYHEQSVKLCRRFKTRFPSIMSE